jgi:hypothetical protein
MELRMMRALSGGERETMLDELSSETEKTVGEEGGGGEGGTGSAGDELGALAGLKPAALRQCKKC